jgi:hypothetical protein
VCDLYRAQGDKERVFFVEPQNKGQEVSRFEPQNRQLRFGDLGIKMIATVSCLGLKNKRVIVYQLCHKTDGRMKMT